jgi:hypothetical protein
MMDARAATRRRVPHVHAQAGHAAGALDSSSASRDGRYQVAGGLVPCTAGAGADAADESPMLKSGRWSVQGQLLPWNGEEEQPAAPEADAREPHLAADLSIDGAINTDDLLCLLIQWGACPANDGEPHHRPPCPADLDDDDTVSETDLLQMIRRWSMHQDD